MPNLLPSTRTFKVWEYQVSHGQLLLRSPKSPALSSSAEQLTNLDIVFGGVEYMALPRLFRGVELVQPTLQELETLSSMMGCSLGTESVVILKSGLKRFPVVAATVAVSENDWDIFDSPIEFRSQFRKTPE